MIIFQHDFAFFQFGDFTDGYPKVCIIGDVSGNDTEAPIVITSRQMLFETFGNVDKPTWRAVDKTLYHGCVVTLFDRTDYALALFDVVERDWEGADVLRRYIDVDRVAEQLKVARPSLTNYLINESGGDVPVRTMNTHHYLEPYSPPKYADSLPDPKRKGKPMKQHGPQSRRQWWNK